MESTNKNRLLFLLRYLYENTNDDNKVSTSQLLDIIQQNGIRVSRNTLSNDIKTITDAGFDIISGNGPSNENLYHWGSRTFDLPELKLLIDAVSSARFINEKMSTRLIEKLASLASLHDKTPLKARIYKNCHYAKATLDPDTNAVTFGTPVAIPGAVNLSLDPEGDTEPFYADDMVYYTTVANNGYSGDLEIALIPDSFRKDILKETEDSNGVLVEDSTVEPEHFALLFEFSGDKKKIRHCMYYCTAARPTIEGKTNEDSKEVQTESLEITATPLPSGLVKVKTGANTTDEVYNGWYSAVYQSPTTEPTEQGQG